MNKELRGGTRMYIVRHAETDLPNHITFAGGNSDVPLSDNGRKQAHDLVERFERRKIHQIVSSDMIRTQETAAPVAQHKGIEVVTNHLLRERRYGGIIEGTHEGDVDKVKYELFKFWKTEHAHRKNIRLTHDMETDDEMMDRVLPVLRGIGETHQNESVLVMAHCDVITTFMQAALTHEPCNMENTGEVVVDFKNGNGFTLVNTKGILKG